MVQAARPLRRSPPQQPIPTTQIPHRRLPAQRAHTPDTSSSPPPRPARPDNDDSRATGAIRAVAPECRPTPNAAADTGLTPRPPAAPPATPPPRGGGATERVAAGVTESILGAPVRLRGPAPNGPSSAHWQPATAIARTSHEPGRSGRRGEMGRASCRERGEISAVGAA